MSDGNNSVSAAVISPEKQEDLLGRLRDGVIKFDEDMVRDAATELIDLHWDAYTGVMDGLAAGMEEVGRLFEAHTYWVPEVLMCADALYAGLDILRPNIVVNETKRVKGEVVIGVVQGDVHDIGKNLVKMMFDVAGFTVHDLGCDVPLEEFVKEQIKTESDIVCLSAMMTTTMLGIPKVIKMIKDKNPNVQVMVGGAPVTHDFADKVGADGFSENASNAVAEAIRMVGALRRM